VQNFKAGQLAELNACQERFRSAVSRDDPEAMVVENNRFHELVGEMANSAFLKPSLNKLLIDHARIGHTFFRPTSAETRANLAKSCRHHDDMIQAIVDRDEEAMVELVFDHWELSRRDMEIFIAPKGLHSETLSRLPSAAVSRKPRGRRPSRA